jgi:histone H3/H4
MKNAVPGTSKISKEAKDAVQECVSEFISFITSEAAEKCHEEKRKTIGGEDVLYAMMMLGFEQYVEPLKIYLSKMRQVRPPHGLVLPTPLSHSSNAVCPIPFCTARTAYCVLTQSPNSLPGATRLG